MWCGARPRRSPARWLRSWRRIQGLLREEVLKLRELMQQMKSLEVDSSNFVRFLADTVERFQRETGIGARFVSEVEQPHMPPSVCRELARIVQEGLVNVRKHSKATESLVRFSENGTHWMLPIEDNGKGFPFSGTMIPGGVAGDWARVRR